MDDDDDFFGGDEQEAQRKIAERELKKMENEMTSMGFRHGALESIENEEQTSLNKGLFDGIESTQLEGNFQGKIGFVKAYAAKKHLNQEVIDEVNSRLNHMNVSASNELGKEKINLLIQDVLQIIKKN